MLKPGTIIPPLKFEMKNKTTLFILTFSVTSRLNFLPDLHEIKDQTDPEVTLLLRLRLLVLTQDFNLDEEEEEEELIVLSREETLVGPWI